MEDDEFPFLMFKRKQRRMSTDILVDKVMDMETGSLNSQDSKKKTILNSISNSLDRLFQRNLSQESLNKEKELEVEIMEMDGALPQKALDKLGIAQNVRPLSISVDTESQDSEVVIPERKSSITKSPGPSSKALKLLGVESVDVQPREVSPKAKQRLGIPADQDLTGSLSRKAVKTLGLTEEEAQKVPVFKPMSHHPSKRLPSVPQESPLSPLSIGTSPVTQSPLDQELQESVVSPDVVPAQTVQTKETQETDVSLPPSIPLPPIDSPPALSPPVDQDVQETPDESVATPVHVVEESEETVEAVEDVVVVESIPDETATVAQSAAETIDSGERPTDKAAIELALNELATLDDTPQSSSETLYESQDQKRGLHKAIKTLGISGIEDAMDKLSQALEEVQTDLPQFLPERTVDTFMRNQKRFSFFDRERIEPDYDPVKAVGLDAIDTAIMESEISLSPTSPNGSRSKVLQKLGITADELNGSIQAIRRQSNVTDSLSRSKPSTLSRKTSTSSGSFTQQSRKGSVLPKELKSLQEIGLFDPLDEESDPQLDQANSKALKMLGVSDEPVKKTITLDQKETVQSIPMKDRIVSGYLVKLESSIFKQNQKRFFLLTNKEMHCFRSNAGHEKTMGSLKMSSRTRIQPSDRGKFVLEIDSGHVAEQKEETTWYLQCNDQVELLVWLRAVKNVVSRDKYAGSALPPTPIKQEPLMSVSGPLKGKSFASRIKELSRTPDMEQIVHMQHIAKPTHKRSKSSSSTHSTYAAPIGSALAMLDAMETKERLHH
ncbi:hypothetical protein EDD86DRAFT_208062 [Gorgonomyces haynaldii]|nr:hypothetical protein EDD86DRAFT_208062 [Gorgonomyces haynaldii]